MKVAIVYDRVNKWGGAERVILTLHEIFPEAPLYTSVYDPKLAPWASVFPKVIPSFLNKFEFLRDKHEILAPLMPFAFESFNFDQYDLVISATSEAAKGIITKPETLHLCYCLTPTRYLWSHYGTYFKETVFQKIAGPIVSYLKIWDRIAAQRPDVMIAISQIVQKRIKKFYGRESEIIYPPLNIEKFVLKNLISKDYYLVVSRLVRYKRIDLVVAAFNELRYPLIIVGSGREEGKLRQMAGKNIEFKSRLTDTELSIYYQKALGLVFAGEEDFGLVMAEATALGTPVISYKKGGSLDIIDEGRNGIFFEYQTKESIIKAVKKFKNMKFDRNVVQKKAEKFSSLKFKKKFLQLVSQFVKNKKI